jgi:hypothetical protein
LFRGGGVLRGRLTVVEPGLTFPNETVDNPRAIRLVFGTEPSAGGAVRQRNVDHVQTAQPHALRQRARVGRSDLGDESAKDAFGLSLKPLIEHFHC